MKREPKIKLPADDTERLRARVEADLSLATIEQSLGKRFRADYLYTVHTGIQWVHAFRIVPNPANDDPRGSFLGVAASDRWSPRAGRPRLRLIVGGLEGHA